MNPVPKDLQWKINKKQDGRKEAVEDDKRMSLLMEIPKRASGHKAGKVNAGTSWPLSSSPVSERMCKSQKALGHPLDRDDEELTVRNLYGDTGRNRMAQSPPPIPVACTRNKCALGARG